MLRRPFLAALALLALAVPVPARVVLAAEPADLVLLNATVHTVDLKRPRAEAVAVRGNRIAAVGTSAEIQAYVGPRSRVMDLRGRTVVPGFDDAHAHFLGIGFARLDVDLVGTASFDEVVARVEKAVQARAPGEWIRGRGWHEEKWTAPARGAVRGFPTHASLSAISPDNPVVLERADGHAVLVNAKAMAHFGITRATRPPEGGEIIHDAAGEPTGVFVDNAERLVTPQERTGPELRRALALAMDECLEKGVTSLTDAGAPVELVALYKEMAAAGTLRTRLYVMASGLATMRALGKPESGLGSGLLDVRSVKLYADGALGSRGAALLEPYADDAGNLGLVRTPPEEMLEAARFALAHGFQVGDPRDRRPGQPHGARHLREGARRAARAEGPALPHRARADPRRPGHPALRPARRAGLDAGHPLSLRPPLGAEAPRRRPRGRGRLRLAQAPRLGGADRERHRRARRGRLADPELPRLGHASRRRRAAARRLRPGPEAHPRWRRSGP